MPIAEDVCDVLLGDGYDPSFLARHPHVEDAELHPRTICLHEGVAGGLHEVFAGRRRSADDAHAQRSLPFVALEDDGPAKAVALHETLQLGHALVR